MQILLIHSAKMDQPTGIVTHVCQLAASLARKGHNVQVIMRGQQETEFIQNNVQFSLFSNFYKFYRAIAKQKISSQIIHCHDILSLAACVPRGHRPYVYTNHSVFADPDFYLSYLEWQNIHRLNYKMRFKLKMTEVLGNYLLSGVKTIAVCEFVRTTISRIYGVPEPAIVVIYNGINTDDFQFNESKSEHKKSGRILFIKPNDSRKGLHHLMEAMPLVLEKVPDARLIAAGPEPEGEYRSYILKLMNDYQISDKVIFTGKIPFAKLVSCYQSSDVVVMPSVYEAFPIVALEAGICGKPVIASDVGGMREVIVDGYTGYCVNTKDPAIFANAILALLQDRAVRIQMGEAAKQRVIMNFTWEKISADVERVYQKAIGYYSE